MALTVRKNCTCVYTAVVSADFDAFVVHDVGSFETFLNATDGQAAVESCSVYLTILGRSLQVSKDSEQIQMSGLNTSSQRSMEALYCVVSARSIVSYRQPRRPDADFCKLLWT